MQLTSGMIYTSWRLFNSEWADAGASWKDVVARSFQKRHLAKIETGVMAFASASAVLESAADSARNELSKAQSLLSGAD